MKKFALHTILPAGEKDFSKGIYIILFNANSLPPHLLLSIHGEVYSITDSGRQLASPLEKLIGFINRKNIPTVFVEWNLSESNIEKLQNKTKENFLKYEKVVEGKVSCLFPIRDVAADILGDEMKTAEFIFELLPMMEKINALGKTFALNMEKEIVNGSFELLTYTNEQLKQALRIEHG